MYPLSKEDDTLAHLIQNKKISTFFQPIVSVVKKSVIGLEGLSRGKNSLTGEFIPPDILFKKAIDSTQRVALDRLCREKALNAYQEIVQHDPDLLLFLNIDASILDKVVGSKHLLRETFKRNLQVDHIVIEINETKVNDLRSLKNFIDNYREYGFLIALDDVGSGFSNLDRIPLTKPDIIKIDRGLLQDLDKQYYKQEVFKSLVGLSKNIGALVVAEGIETVEEAFISLELGADLLQGYYFSRPVEAAPRQIYRHEDKINLVASRFSTYVNTKNKNERLKLAKYDIMIQDVRAFLMNVSRSELDGKMKEILNKLVSVDCMYVLDSSGFQISETACRPNLKTHRSSIFQPAQKGENHSLKSYYYSLVNFGLAKYVTSPYISMATGKLCITISATCHDCDNENIIFCMDFDPDYFCYDPWYPSFDI
ncbi:MAG: EAL domain-containing protein [Peptococcaceae bacterium]|nr:EAL domain-containing protein [Peptococcaceae bacterium]